MQPSAHRDRHSAKAARCECIAPRSATEPYNSAPHLKFADYGGHGYAMVRVSSERMETDFVCIPRPLEPVATPDGGPLRYKVRHSVDMWRPGEPPRLTQQFIEGEAPLSI